VIDRDAEVDALYHETFRSLLRHMMDDSRMIQRGIHLQSVAKWLERMADHATNIAEQVVFMVKGKDIRHVGHLSAPPPRS
jgi:phosphate transport system protein